jgi:hypothetical protein
LPSKADERLPRRADETPSETFLSAAQVALAAGHRAIPESLVAVRFLAEIARNWNLIDQGLRPKPLQPDTFLAQMKRGAGYGSIGFPGLSYFSLEEGNFETAEKLALTMIAADQYAYQARFVLAFLYHHFLEMPREAGQIYKELSMQPDAPAWMADLGQKLIDRGADPELDLSPHVLGSLCQWLLRSAPGNSRERLKSKCTNGQGPEPSKP